MCHFYGYDSVKWSIKVDIQRNCSYFINSMNLLVIIHVFDKYKLILHIQASMKKSDVCACFMDTIF